MKKLLPALFLGTLAGFAGGHAAHAQSCGQGSVMETLEQPYQNVNSLNLFARFNLRTPDCAGRALTAVIVDGSSSDAEGSILLVKNGRPEGVLQTLTSDSATYTFSVDPFRNQLGTDIDQLELRLGGNIYVEAITLVFGDATPPAATHSAGQLLATTSLSGSSRTSLDVSLDSAMPAYREIVLSSYDRAFVLEHAVLYYDNNTRGYVGTQAIATNGHLHILVPEGRTVTRATFSGYATGPGAQSRLEVNGIQ